jgi:hypothetical protein
MQRICDLLKSLAVDKAEGERASSFAIVIKEKGNVLLILRLLDRLQELEAKFSRCLGCFCIVLVHCQPCRLAKKLRSRRSLEVLES